MFSRHMNTPNSPTSETSENLLLSRRFPRLWFSGAADSFLRRCNGANFSKQMRERGISRIVCVPFLISQTGLSIGEDGNFLIPLATDLSIEGQAGFLGCEIGHTFHYNLTYTPPKDLLSELSETNRDDVKSFCCAFSMAWLERNSPKSVLEWLGNDPSRSALIPFATII